MNEKQAPGISPTPSPPPAATRRKGHLRCGFSTGTAVTAAARAALRLLLTGDAPTVVAVRLPAGYYLPVSIRENRIFQGIAVASAIKDGGDDPDVTHNAELRASVRLFRIPRAARDPGAPPSSLRSPDEWKESPGIRIIGGEGVGIATKAGLPIGIGEPAVNPAPRGMLLQNLTEEMLSQGSSTPRCGWEPGDATPRKSKDIPRPNVFLPFTTDDRILTDILIEVEIQVPRGAELAVRTLNPRLGIVDGISILGTTGLVRPFSHKAYEETIQAALSVAVSNGCKEVVLSTGGKSERLAQAMLKMPRSESFVQIADFFAFALGEARKMGFEKVVLSAFFGKVVKMAQGHPYTHAHTTPLDLSPLAGVAREAGFDALFCRDLASANTARHALELLLAEGAAGVIRTVAERAMEEACRFGGHSFSTRLLLFDYDGSFLVDLERPC